MTNKKFTCDVNDNDFMEIRTDASGLYIQVSQNKTISILVLGYAAKIQELIDCLEKAKEDLYQ